MKKTFNLDPSMNDRLKRFAEEQGMSEADVIRLSLKYVMDEVSRGFSVVVSSETVFK